MSGRVPARSDLAWRSPAQRRGVALLERDPDVAALARANIAANGLEERVVVACCDVLDAAARRALSPAALVLTNPPFFDATTTRASPNAGRRAARTLDAPLGDWIAACLDLLAPKGVLMVVHAVEAVPALLAAIGARAGAIVVKPIQPRQGQPARRVLLRATRDSRKPFALAAPLVLHADGRFTDEAERLHRGEAALDW